MRCGGPRALTFDRLDVDGSCSTNDTVLLLASGASEIAPSQADLDDAVLRVCDDLCAQLQADAEGVTKRVVVTVTGAATEADALDRGPCRRARQPASRPRCSAPTRTGAGCWPPSAWPQFASTPERISVSFNGSPVCIDGVGAPGAREVDLSGRRHRRHHRPRRRDANARAIRTTDLSHGYVEENSAYSS